MTTEPIAVTIHSRNNRDLPETRGNISRINWDAADRSKNAVKTVGIGLGATFACVFVPILHFVLVPALFIATFVVAIDKSREHQRNAGGVGECPKCHKEFVIEKSAWKERLTDTCGNCHDDIEINVTS
jgi:hypothetical protein